MKKEKKINVINFPAKLVDGEREVEAIIFAAAEPLDVDTIESKVSKKSTHHVECLCELVEDNQIPSC